MIEGFGRALVKASRFGFDPANRETVLKHAAAANPQEGEDTALANALFDELQRKMNIGDQKEGYGYLPPRTGRSGMKACSPPVASSSR